jgi:hypothetical protein
VTDAAGHEAFEGAPGRPEHLLQIVIDSIPQRVFWKDRNLVYLGCNRSHSLGQEVREVLDAPG